MKDCQNCPDRSATCHAECSDYMTRWNAARAKEEEKSKQPPDYWTAARKTLVRTIVNKRNEKHKTW